MPRRRVAQKQKPASSAVRSSSQLLNFHAGCALRTTVQAILPRTSLPGDRDRLLKAQSEVTTRSNKKEQRTTFTYHQHQTTSALEMVRHLLYCLDITLLDPMETLLRTRQKQVLQEIYRLTGGLTTGDDGIPLSVAMAQSEHGSLEAPPSSSASEAQQPAAKFG